MGLGRRFAGVVVALVVGVEAFAALPVAAAPVVGPERLVADRVVTRAPWTQREPAVAFDGTNFLVVWVDERIELGPTFRVRGARVTPAGRILDPSGFTIARGTDGYEPGNPDLAFDGTNFLVVWQATDEIVDPPFHYSRTRLSSVRVTTGGTVLGAPRRLDEEEIFQILPAMRIQPAVAYDGSGWTVVWQRFEPGGVAVRRVDSSGTPINPVLHLGSGSSSQPDIARLGSGTLVVWVEEANQSNTTSITATRLGANGSVLDPTPLVLADEQPNVVKLSPALATGRVASLVVWEEVVDATHRRLSGTRIGPKGSIASPDGVPLLTDVAARSMAPTVASDGSGWFVGFERGGAGTRDVSGFRVDPFGQRTGAVVPFASGAGAQSAPAAGFGGDRYLLVWQDPRDATDVVAARMTRTGALLDVPGFVVSTSRTDQRDPAIAFDGTNHLVVWTKRRHNSHELRGSRLRPDGSRIDGAGFRIGEGGYSPPAVSYDGQNYVVVWVSASSGDGVATRITKGGTVLDSPPVVIAQGGGNAAISSDPVSHTSLIVFGYDGVRGVRLSGAGKVLDTSPIPISPPDDPINGLHLDLSYNGRDFVVVHDAAPDGRSEVRAVRVSLAGAVRDPDGILLSGTTTAVNPTIASIGSNSLIVWSRFGATSSESGLYAARLSAGGAVLAPPRRIDPRPGAHDVVANGDYLVAVTWNTLFGIRLRPDGTTAGSKTVLADGVFDGAPALARSQGDDFAVTYSRVVTDPEAAAFLRNYSPS